MKKEFFSMAQLVLVTLAVRGNTYISTMAYAMAATITSANIRVQITAGNPVVVVRRWYRIYPSPANKRPIAKRIIHKVVACRKFCRKDLKNSLVRLLSSP